MGLKVIQHSKEVYLIYSKPPFGGPEHVLNYLGRYTHRVAISNHRLLAIDHGKVAFSWKDYRDHDRQRIMTLDADEFIRRFLLHVLPDGFQRIRHCGFLGHRYRQAKLALCRKLLGVVLPVADPASLKDKPGYRELYEKLTGKSLRRCPVLSRWEYGSDRRPTPLGSGTALYHFMRSLVSNPRCALSTCFSQAAAALTFAKEKRRLACAGQTRHLDPPFLRSRHCTLEPDPP